MSKGFWRGIQAILGVALIVFILLNLADKWSEVASQPIAWQLRWEFVIASLLVTWVMYALLVWGWRAILHGWRQYIRAVDAARIWTISSLGKYVPGKVWSIAGMAVMAERAGVSGVAATGSAVIMQLVNLASGAIVALMLTGTVVFDRLLAPYVGGWGSVLAFAGAAFALLCCFALTLPSLTRRIGHLIGRPESVQPVEPGALAGALFVNFLAWGGYGLALQLLLLGTIPGVEISWTTATGAFAASYIAGYLALVAPGGLGVREAVLVALLQGPIGLGPAIAIAAASRITLTINEIGAAVPFLLMRRPSRDDA
jgi:uncharacterized membrane protein YbhN (UPF0104 family)